MKRLHLVLPVLLAACGSEGLLPTQSSTAVNPVAASASSAPARFQESTVGFHLDYLGYLHDYVISLNPCTGAVSGSGQTPINSGYYTEEAVTGSFVGSQVTYSAVYTTQAYNPGYTYSGGFSTTAPGTQVVTLTQGGGDLPGANITVTSSTSSTWKNHGEFVAAHPDLNDAPHSCIGMPIVH